MFSEINDRKRPRSVNFQNFKAFQGCGNTEMKFYLSLGKLSEKSYLSCFLYKHLMFVCLIVLNATFNSISVISWGPVLVVEEAGVLGENH